MGGVDCTKLTTVGPRPKAELVERLNVKKLRKRDGEAGLSILEMMVVLGIMALVIGLVAPRAMSYFGRAKSQTAEIQMHQVQNALKLLYIDIGRYPTESEGLELLLSAPPGLTGWEGPYLDEEEGLRDPWGRRYLLRIEEGRSAPRVVTHGRDGQPGGSGEDADISV